MIKAFIFDLDGVICHTDKYHYLAWKSVADELGIPFDETVNNRLRGVSRMESLDIILENTPKEYSQEEKEELAQRKNQRYQEMLKGMTPSDLDDQVLSTLHVLRKRGLKLAIGSSSKNAQLILKQLGLEHYFDAVSDGTNITHSKPDPEVFLKAAEFLGMNPRDCVVVEDAFAGIEAACRGGFLSVGIGDAADCPKATWRIHQFSQLLGLKE